MPKSYGVEYAIIIAAAAASFSVPVFANSLVALADLDGTAPAYQSPTVRTLGTVPESAVQNEPAAGGQAYPSTSKGGMTMQSANQPLQPLDTNGITYITGGIGDEERAELESIKPDYNLHIVSAGRDGEYFGNTHIVIHDRRGNELLNVSAGPIFYAELPANSYVIEARSEGQTQKQTVTVGEHKSSFVHFTWH